MNVSIDPNSGFCFGVVYAIEMAEDELDANGKLYCLGDIVHNNMEVERLKKKGLEIIDHDQFSRLSNTKVLIRAHGEPPETYKIAIENNIELIDASCPVVLKLQHRVKDGYEEVTSLGGQVVIYGKEGHAEVNGLVGQTSDNAIIVTEKEDLEKVDFTKPIYFYSQTTKSTKGFVAMRDEIARRIVEQNGDPEELFVANDTLCRQVSNREPQLEKFAKEHDVVVFVAGKKSSNGKILHSVCEAVNPRSYFVSQIDELKPEWFTGMNSVGVCGATSTPRWLMDEVAREIEGFNLQKAV